MTLKLCDPRRDGSGLLDRFISNNEVQQVRFSSLALAVGLQDGNIGSSGGWGVAGLLENRMTNVEGIIANLPDDLDARFAGMDEKVTAVRETQLLHTQRSSTTRFQNDLLQTRIDRLEGRQDGLEAHRGGLEVCIESWDMGRGRLEMNFGVFDARFSGQSNFGCLQASYTGLDRRMGGHEPTVDRLDVKVASLRSAVNDFGTKIDRIDARRGRAERCIEHLAEKRPGAAAALGEISNRVDQIDSKNDLVLQRLPRA